MLELMLPVAGQIIKLFLLIIVGFAAIKIGAVPKETGAIFSKLLLNITLPCTILSSVLGSGSNLPMGSLLLCLLYATLALLISFGIGYVLPKYVYKAGKDTGTHAFLGSQSNFGFMGIPVTLSVFGPGAGIYSSLVQIPANLLTYSLGIKLIAPAGEKMSIKKLLLNTGSLSSILALVLYFAKVKLPDVIFSSVELLAGITTPGAMLIIGMTLASYPLKGLFTDFRLYCTLLVRLVVVPLAVLGFMKLVHADPFFTSVFTLQLAMPSATITAMLSIQYGGNANLAGKGIFLTTLISAVTLPVWAAILM